MSATPKRETSKLTDELAEPDHDMLQELLQELDTGDLTEFDADELERLMTQISMEEPVADS